MGDRSTEMVLGKKRPVIRKHMPPPTALAAAV
jgi:hypothetical protein